jgi:DNA-binding transcriptional MerR regulator
MAEVSESFVYPLFRGDLHTTACYTRPGFRMPDTSTEFTIPDRPAFKAAEVCEIAKLQPYVLRSWESEFPDLGVARTPGGPRVYRKPDVERVLRIRQLVFQEGLTLAGVRRRLDGAGPTPQPPLPDDSSLFHEVLGADLKARLAQLKTGLKSLLEMVSRDPVAPLRPIAPMGDFQLEAPAPVAHTPAATKRPASRRKTAEHA